MIHIVWSWRGSALRTKWETFVLVEVVKTGYGGKTGTLINHVRIELTGEIAFGLSKTQHSTSTKAETFSILGGTINEGRNLFLFGI